MSDKFAPSVVRKENGRTLMHKNRARVYQSTQLRLNEGCNHQFFKTLNHDRAHCCCTKHTHAHTKQTRIMPYKSRNNAKIIDFRQEPGNL